MTSPFPVPDYVGGHGLLTGRIVVVTAAAGAGIGAAVAKKAVEEGATVVVSDAHERRLDEIAEKLAEVVSAATQQDPAGADPTAEPDLKITDSGKLDALFDVVKKVDVVKTSADAAGAENVVDVFKNTEVNAALAASIFHYETHSVNRVKEMIKQNGIPVRY